MDGVMQLGVVGKDGRLGGRLERELEAYEEIIKGKRKGYRDKVKARESVGDADVEDERGEPSNKKARRMSGDEDVDDEEERMLEEQLNGVSGSRSAAQETSNGVDKSVSLLGVTAEMIDRLGEESDGAEVDEDGDEAEAEEDEDDEDDGGEDEDEDEDEQHDEADQQDADETEADADDTEALGERGHAGERGRIALMPDGNVEMGSDDESD